MALLWIDHQEFFAGQNSNGFTPQLTVAGAYAFALGKERTLFVGTGLNMWHNQYGIKPIDGSTDGFHQTAMQALVKYHV